MFELPEEVKKGIATYRQELEELLEGKISPDRFKGIRVPWGIYSHRGGQVFMTRVRIPAGEVSARQLKALAFVAQKYGNGKLHITTRQDIQIHEVALENTSKIMEHLKDFDLSPRGGGGNTVRNITSCVLAGVCQEEIFDVRGQALALTEELLKEEDSFKLPRKYKIAFAGCAKGWRSYLLNDLGFLAKVEKGKAGYQVFVGGGMGASPRVGRELEKFIPIEQVSAVAEAVKRVFNARGDRKNKHHNRLRFLIEDLGFEEFFRLYTEERRQLNGAALREIKIPEHQGLEGDIAQAAKKEYQEFLRYNVRPQKQKGFSCVELRVPQGDIAAEQLVALAEMEQAFPGIKFRATQNQNLLVGWLSNNKLTEFFNGLTKILDNFLYPKTLLDVVACKGALTCNIGICNSPGLAQEIEKLVKAKFIGSEVFKKLDLKLNGCPNACGHHPLGKIALHGLVKRIDNRPVPFYKLLIGGMRKEGKIKLAQEVGILPAKNVPQFLNNYLDQLEKKLAKGINVYEFLDQEAKEIARELLVKYGQVPSYEENQDFYRDFGKEEDFSLSGIGPGECGVGVIDMIESDLKEARKYLDLASPNFKELYQVLLYSARALLVVKGIEPRSDTEIMSKFKENFVDEGIIAYRFENIAQFALDLLKEEIKKAEALEYLRELLAEVGAAYQGMDSNFKFMLREEVKEEAAKTSASEKGVNATEILMDLRGVKCPINYVKAKLKLETMQKGEKLLLYLDPGEPIQNVPASFKNDGQAVMKIEEKDNYFEVLVKKEV